MVHGRYRSVAPSGENRVVDQETSLLREAGHEVRRPSSGAATTSPTGPWAPGAAAAAQRAQRSGAQSSWSSGPAPRRPDVVHVHNTFPLLSASVLLACRDAGVPVVATVHNYKLLCASGDFYRAGRPCHDCADGQVAPGAAARLLPRLPRGDAAGGRRAAGQPAGLAAAGGGVRADQRLAARRCCAAWQLPRGPRVRQAELRASRRRPAPAARAPGGAPGPARRGQGDPAADAAWERHVADLARLPAAARGRRRRSARGRGARAWARRARACRMVGTLDPARGRRRSSTGPCWRSCRRRGRRSSASWPSRPWPTGRCRWPRRAAPSPSWCATAGTGCSSRPAAPTTWPACSAGVDRTPEHHLALGARARTTWARRFSPRAQPRPAALHLPLRPRPPGRKAPPMRLWSTPRSRTRHPAPAGEG